MGCQVRDRSIAALLPRMHGDIVELRIVKDPAEIELMKQARHTDTHLFHLHAQLHTFLSLYTHISQQDLHLLCPVIILHAPIFCRLYLWFRLEVLAIVM